MNVTELCEKNEGCIARILSASTKSRFPNGGAHAFTREGEDTGITTKLETVKGAYCT